MLGVAKIARFLLVIVPALAVAQHPAATVWDNIRRQLPENSGIQAQVLHDEVVRVTRPDGVRFRVRFPMHCRNCFWDYLFHKYKLALLQLRILPFCSFANPAPPRPQSPELMR